MAIEFSDEQQATIRERQRIVVQWWTTHAHNPHWLALQMDEEVFSAQKSTFLRAWMMMHVRAAFSADGLIILDSGKWREILGPVSYTHLTLPTNREV